MLYDKSENGLIKIIDFGTAVKINPSKPFTNLIGTPFYIAPEVISGKYNELCDVWACGVILYIIMSGSPPFQGKNQAELFERISTAPISFESKNITIQIRYGINDPLKSRLSSNKCWPKSLSIV